MSAIPVLRPRLPSAEQVAPYLRKIDASRIYSSFGPLARSFEDRIAAHFGLGGTSVATVTNATAGLSLALGVAGAREGTLCALPAWTFIASAHAVKLAGLVPFFIDVDASTWALDPEEIIDELARAPAPVGAVMAVAPFGRPIDCNAWDRFAERTGLAVVIDAAAAFDSLIPAITPTVVSLHATKVFAVGEGGLVISKDPSIIHAIRVRSNFGFDGSRQALAWSMNAKLSEYHAAVGHAALDEWSSVRAEWMMVAQAYRAALQESSHLRFQSGFGDAWIASTCVLQFGGNITDVVETALATAGIDTRRWWGRGAHRHPATAGSPGGKVPMTEQLAGSTLGLPFGRDLRSDEIGRIADVVLSVIDGSRASSRGEPAEQTHAVFSDKAT